MNHPIERASLAPVAKPGRVGQATAVEQSRAVAEVHAAVLAAWERPRNAEVALAEVLRSCSNLKMAERAFFSFPRGRTTIAGPSVHLARELARCWGNIQHGVNELRRDDEHGESEMLAWAWDIETNARSSQTFIVPHARDANGARQPLKELRDVYENNANNGARRLREAIFAVLPPWLIEEAKERCSATLEAGDGSELADRITEAVSAYAARGIGAERLERKIGRPRDAWTAQDVATLDVVFRSISRRETTVAEEFPEAEASPAVTEGEILGARKPASPPPAPSPEDLAHADAEAGLGGAQ
ncbi:hypothetical protein [Streptomyces halstedii]|uniref:hypothetical protein n=1 Tax=Streptomyces halstedii TaxID=1944 RepID=UPI00336479C2